VKRLFLFAVAGGLGFVSDAGMLAFLIWATPIGPFWARVVAIAFAMCVTWIFNRSLTFGRSDHSLAAEGARYGGVGIVSALFNYAIYSAILLLFPGLYPVIAAAIASVAAMGVSWFGYSRLVFGR
jgi:putative flippase GtrA